jgi:hypothetical protein
MFLPIFISFKNI